MDAASLIDAQDPLERQNHKLRRIVEVLMRRVQQSTDDSGAGYAHFERAITLDHMVTARTRDLEEALELLNVTNGRLTAAIREAEEARANLAAALEAVEEGFALFDASDRLVMKNSRFAAMTPDVAGCVVPGLDFEDYIKMVSESSGLCLPAGTDRGRWRDARIAAHRRKSVNFTVEFEGDRWLQISEQRTPDGGTTILQTDVTSMVRLEREERQRLLDRQSRIVKATLDHIEQGVAIFDPEQRLAGWNERFRQLLHPPAKLMREGTDFAILAGILWKGGAAPPASRNLVDWALHDGRRRPLRLELDGPNGAILGVHGREMPDRGFVITFSDVTPEREAAAALTAAKQSLEQRVAERTRELRTARDAAERANASKSRFVAAASHDLLQPLNAAKLYMASLAEHDLTDRQRIVVDRLGSAFGSVEALLGSLLEISKLDSGVATVNLSTFPLEQILAPIRRDFQGVAARKGLDFRVVPSAVQVQSDPSYLRRILQNLVSNAIRYTERGRVLVGARRQGDMARLIVQDTGPGIAEEDRETIFMEFRRLDQRIGETPGMGLGLAIVERACGLLGHGLSLDSRPGRGTQFAVDVPRVERPHQAPLQPGTPAGGKAPDLSGQLILVLDDNAGVRHAMTTLLGSWGATPLEAATPAEAVSVVAALDLVPDAVIADYHLPGGETGLDVIETIRRREGRFTAILVTADRDPNIRSRAVAASVFLRYKPVGAADLANLLQGGRRSETGTAGTQS